MAHWAVVIGDERFEAERLFHHDALQLTGLDAGSRRPRPGDEVLVVARAPTPVVVALGRVTPPGAARDPEDTPDHDDPESDADAGPLTVAYTQRSFDAPGPADGLALDGPVIPVDAADYRRLADALPPAAAPRRWFVSVDLPIEADSAAEAVRQFWSYVMELGPRELPAFVSPADDELSMQAYVLGEQTNLDPEEDKE
ncbi:MAG TPA: hypothetical protein VGJ53_06575 [Micromonosporaceae bacterium]|jgi:hypothetical protein